MECNHLIFAGAFYPFLRFFQKNTNQNSLMWCRQSAFYFFSHFFPPGCTALCFNWRIHATAHCMWLFFFFINVLLFFFFAAAASVPASETESVNTENQNGEDEKTPCCGPLWWERTSVLFKKKNPDHCSYFKFPNLRLMSLVVQPLLQSLKSEELWLSVTKCILNFVTFFDVWWKKNGWKKQLASMFILSSCTEMLLTCHLLTSQSFANSSVFQSKNFKVKVQVSIFVGLCLCMMLIVS